MISVDADEQMRLNLGALAQYNEENGSYNLMANESIDPVGGDPEKQHCIQLSNIVKHEEVVMQGLVTTELQATNTWRM